MFRMAQIVVFISFLAMYLKENPPVEQGIQMFEQGYLPDFVTRFGIRMLLQARIKEATKANNTMQQDAQMEFIEELRNSPIAIETEAANEQHYEVDSRFYELALGPHLKYSSALYETGTPTSEAAAKLGEAESRMFDLYAEKAQLKGGLRVIEFGCGWGSLTLYNAAKFPTSTFVGVSYSNSQREYIMEKAERMGLTNVQILTADMNTFELPEGMEQFDRLISIEMFEHMKNYEKLLAKVSRCLKLNGKMFVHTFNHKTLSYHFVAQGPDDWMSRYFFTGGTMASAHTLHYFQKDLTLVGHWQVNGMNYALTSEAWLQNTDNNKEKILSLFEEYYGEGKSELWFQRWRAFWMACAECFAWDNGNEWFVGLYLFEKQR